MEVISLDSNITSIYVKVFCGEDQFLIWDESHHNFGLCFQKLFMCGFSFVFFALFSAFYAGKKTSLFIRTKSQKIFIILRILVSISCLVLAILQPCLLKFYAHLQVYWVDIFTSAVQSFTWLVHLAYLSSLRYHLSRGTRGPRPVIASWVLTLICSISSAKTAWSINFPHDYLGLNDSHDVEFELFLLRWLVTTQLGLQVLYLMTLFPRGRCDSGTSQNRSRIDERTPLVDTHYVDYGRFHESFDPLHLGVAEEGVNKLSYLTFHWVNLIMEKGSQARLESVDDLYDLPYSLRSEIVSQKVQKQMLLNQPLSPPMGPEEGEKPPPKYQLLKALHQCFGLRFYAIGILKLGSDCLGFAAPLLLNIIVRFVEGKSDVEKWKGYTAGMGLCLTTLISAFLVVHFNYLMAKINIQLRASLVTAVFRKIQNLSLAHLSSFSSGEIVNLMSTDTDRVINFCQSFHSFWSLPLQLGVTLFLLYNQIGIAFLAGVLFAVFLIPVNKFLASKIGSLSTVMMGFKDRRLDLMNDVLARIKEVKLNSWENLFKKKLMGGSIWGH